MTRKSVSALPTDVMERADVRMRERGNRARFALEPLAELRISSEGFRKDLDGDDAIEARVAGACRPRPCRRPRGRRGSRTGRGGRQVVRTAVAVAGLYAFDWSMPARIPAGRFRCPDQPHGNQAVASSAIARATSWSPIFLSALRRENAMTASKAAAGASRFSSSNHFSPTTSSTPPRQLSTTTIGAAIASLTFGGTRNQKMLTIG